MKKSKLKALESIKKHSPEIDESDEIYNHLKKTYTDEEIADAFIFDVSPSFSDEEEKEFSKFIEKSKGKKIKVVFLDIDGVLKKVSDINFNSRNIDNLNELVRKTNAKIVITSTWKNSNGLEFVKKMLNDAGFKGEIIDETPQFKIEHPNYGDVKVPRGLEIKSWLEKYTSFINEDDIKFVESYVILDDCSDMLIEQFENFVQIDPTKGFDSRYLKNAVEILNTIIVTI